jgi:hypothetical protein
MKPIHVATKPDKVKILIQQQIEYILDTIPYIREYTGMEEEHFGQRYVQNRFPIHPNIFTTLLHALPF